MVEVAFSLKCDDVSWLGLNLRDPAAHIPQSAAHLGSIPHRDSLHLGIKRQNPFTQAKQFGLWFLVAYFGWFMLWLNFFLSMMHYACNIWWSKITVKSKNRVIQVSLKKTWHECQPSHQWNRAAKAHSSYPCFVQNLKHRQIFVVHIHRDLRGDLIYFNLMRQQNW